MKYMLDTDMCIYIIQKQPPEVLNKFERLPLGAVGISSVTLAELQYGVEKSHHKSKNQVALDAFCSALEIQAFDIPAAKHYGKIRTSLESKGTPIGSMDLLIGAHALSLDVTLVTNNIREFTRIPKLTVENWLTKK